MKANEFDQFAVIALEAQPIDKEGMIEPQPINVTSQYFLPSSDKAELAAEEAYEQKLQDFHQELAALRTAFRPYLANHVPKAKFMRQSKTFDTFQFRYHNEGDSQFSRVLDGDGEWESVSIPDFRGPTHEDSRWTGYYRAEFAYGQAEVGKRAILVFKGVDYKANVYVNGKCVGSHEGFFSPFEFDITDLLRDRNTLVVEVSNEYFMLGVNGTKLDGDKLYAAGGPGWDDSDVGWHACPPGGGIYNNVYIEERAELYIQDIFVRPNIDDHNIEVWVDVMNTGSRLKENFRMEMAVMPRNFHGDALQGIRFQVSYAGPGLNYYRYKIPLNAYQLWKPDEPKLYTVRVELALEDVVIDTQDRSFGMRKFHMDESSEPKGTLYLNNTEIVLRGANEMGHLQRCVMENDYDQLVDDILIAKLANINFYRITQRPVQEEIYDCMDQLGMMHQTDLPLFGYLRRNQFCEAVRQVTEMERLIRSHPSSVVVSLINELHPASAVAKGHRHLFQDEMEAFFTAARQAIYVENPDRVVKNADGNYDPPTRVGFQDYHCYTMWYTNHEIPIGKLYRGYLPPMKPGWKAGCGEYGSEGLDNYDVMTRYYPGEWMPQRDDDEWMPDRIRYSQTYNMHGDWFEEQHRIHDWIRESQRHQALATRLMTDALRRKSDVVVSSAIHLLIDAWPSGWMKTLVGVDRIPKPAYFAYQSSLVPVRVNLRGDRWRGYEGDTIHVEAWLLNDTARRYPTCKVVMTVRDDDRDYDSWQIAADMDACRPAYAGSVCVRLPSVNDRRMVYADACLYDANGRLLNKERFPIEVFSKPTASDCTGVAYLGDQAALLCQVLGIPAVPYSPDGGSWKTLVISDSDRYGEMGGEAERFARMGGKLVFIQDDNYKFHYRIDGRIYEPTNMEEVYFTAIDRTKPFLSSFEAGDLAYLYNVKLDRLDYIANGYFDNEELQPLIYGYLKSPNPNTARRTKRKLPIVGRYALGQGEVILSNLQAEGRIGCNPTLDRLFRTLIVGN